MTDLVKGIDALLITNPTNIRYLTGFVGLSPQERECYVLLTRDTLYLFTSSLYIESTRNLISHLATGRPSPTQNKIEIVEISRDKPIEKEIGRVFDSIYTAQRRRTRTIMLGFETNDITVSEYERLKSALKEIQLIATSERIETIRRIKRPDEIASIRQACKIADDCFAFIIKQVNQVSQRVKLHGKWNHLYGRKARSWLSPQLLPLELIRPSRITPQ